MKTRNILAGLAIAVALAGCSDIRTEYSDVKKEEARVTEKHHEDARTIKLPARSGLTIYIRSVHRPELNQITFHGPIDFHVDNSNVFSRFNSNDSVNVSYREVFRATYEDKNKDGTNEFVGKVLTDYEFIDAWPVTNNSNKLNTGGKKWKHTQETH